MKNNNYRVQGNIDISALPPEYIEQWENSVESRIAMELYKQILDNNKLVVVDLKKRSYRRPEWIQNIDIEFRLTNVLVKDITMPQLGSIQFEPTEYLFSEVASELKRRIKSKFRKLFK